MWALPPEWFQWFAIIVVVELALLVLGIYLGPTWQGATMSDVKQAVDELRKAVEAKAAGQAEGQDKIP
ncbi:MAG TPA: hypothetical protein PLT20_00170 [Sedimentisphaerales bacterium]|nr:hypothetical protein [Sedimentisphaerales bacterium]HQI26467.1 hypothetical protein [Sedimentisphaerales bacterium]